ncbi:MAG: hypothetical protein IH868_11325 [Chloroflexi bacterium]|nr:hypothetical protein [Chloroflexota bacterium]
MVSADLKRRVNETPRLKRLAYGLMITGFIIIAASFVIGIALGLSIADLFENAKSVRDAAAPDDAATRGILSQQGTIAATTAWLTPLKFLGLGSFLAGITTILYVVIQSLKLRAESMKVSLPIILGVEEKSAE